MIVACDCGAKLKIDEAKIAGRRVKIRCPRCGNTLAVQQQPERAESPPPKKAASATEGLILVAHDSEVVRYLVSGVLTDAGFQVELAVNGVEALKKALELKPKGIVLDVGLPGIYGFELCERLKGNIETKDIRIILLSSVYDMRRYKRTPASLYGADDYIEKHHIQDSLVSKLRQLIAPGKKQTGAPAVHQPERAELPEMARPPAREFKSSLLNQDIASHPEKEKAPLAQSGTERQAQSDRSDATAVFPESISLKASVFQEEECDVPRVNEGDPEAVEKARRFARIIVSDIALYNQESVIEGITKGTFFELLSNDITEGRDLYEKRIPASVRAKKDFYQEAFDNFIAAAKKKNVR